MKSKELIYQYHSKLNSVGTNSILVEYNLTYKKKKYGLAIIKNIDQDHFLFEIYDKTKPETLIDNFEIIKDDVNFYKYLKNGCLVHHTTINMFIHFKILDIIKNG